MLRINYALCSMLYALCFMLYALCSVLCALCSVLCALCSMLYALCIIWLCWQFLAAAFWTTFYGFVDNFLWRLFLRRLFRRLCWQFFCGGFLDDFIDTFLRLFVLLYMQYKVRQHSTKVCCTFWGGGGGCKSYSMDSLLLSKMASPTLFVTTEFGCNYT
jgi:hypothetical protein